MDEQIKFVVECTLFASTNIMVSLKMIWIYSSIDLWSKLWSSVLKFKDVHLISNILVKLTNCFIEH